jgi:hypothetical protein
MLASRNEEDAAHEIRAKFGPWPRIAVYPCTTRAAALDFFTTHNIECEDERSRRKIGHP